MEFIKTSFVFLFLFTLSKQENSDLHIHNSTRIGTYNTVLYCNVSFTEEEFVERIHWFKDGERLKTYNLEYMNSPTRKTIRAASFFKIPNNGCNEGTYKCNIQTKKSNLKYEYNRNFVVEKRPVIEPIEVYFPNWFDSKMWIKLYVEQEGSNIFIKCNYDNEKFVINEDWYKDKKIKFNDHIKKYDGVLSITNLTSTDKGVYKCVSTDNEYSTVLIVTKNLMKTRKKINH